jgi:hypothetical protein
MKTKAFWLLSLVVVSGFLLLAKPAITLTENWPSLGQLVQWRSFDRDRPDAFKSVNLAFPPTRFT